MVENLNNMAKKKSSKKKTKPPYIAKAGYKPGARYDEGGTLKKKKV